MADLLTHSLDIIIAAVAAWMGYREVQYQIAKSKVQQLENRERQNAIINKVHGESDVDLNRDLKRNFGVRSDKS